MASPPLRRLVLLAYGAPALPLAVLLLPTYIFLPAHYAQLGLSLGTISLVLLAARLWDGVTDPLVGALSDRFGGRFGRRRPWIAAGLPLTCLSLWFLLVPGDGVGWAHLLGWSMALYLGWTLMVVPLTAWGAELSGDYHQRTRINGYREGAGVLGTMVALVLPFALGAGAAGNEGEALRLLALFILISLPLLTLAALLLVPDPPWPMAGVTAQAATPTAGGWRAILGNGPFRRLLLAYVINGMANGLPAQLFLFFVQQRLGEGERAGLLLLCYFASGLLAVPLWLGLSKIWGKDRVWRGAMLWNIAWFLPVFWLGPGDFLPFLLVCVMTGLTLGADLVLPSAMQADVVDLDTATHGEQRAGLFFALWGLATKLATALAALGLGAAGLFGFTPAGPNDAQALAGLTLLYAGLPILLKLLAIALLWRWPLDEAAQAALRRRIEAPSP